MEKGQIFKSYHKLNGEMVYQFIGEESTENGYNIHLFNLSTNTDTFVEDEWFNQRKITLQ